MTLKRRQVLSEIEKRIERALQRSAVKKPKWINPLDGRTRFGKLLKLNLKKVLAAQVAAGTITRCPTPSRPPTKSR